MATTYVVSDGIVIPPMKVYSQDAEPTLGADHDLCMWIDTNDSDRVYLVFRRGSGDQVKIELT